MSTRMTCRPCGRGYSVPHAGRVWSCKQGGEPLIDFQPSGTEADANAPALSKDELRSANAELKRRRQSH